MFLVNRPADWHPVAEYLLRTAAESPLDQPDSASYSETASEMWRRVARGLKAGRIKEMTKFSAIVLCELPTG